MDMRAEQELAKYLDRNLYPNINGAEWMRNNDVTKQLRGVDGYLTINGEQYVVDEKATLYYINRNLPTFAFEINSYQRGCLTDGWLYASKYDTTHYMLIYPNASTSYLGNIQSTDFCNTTCTLVERQAIINYLASNGFTKERIEQDAEILRRNRNYGKRLINNVNGFYYFLSDPTKYSEEPFNVIIRRYVLEQLSEQIIKCP